MHAKYDKTYFFFVFFLGYFSGICLFMKNGGKFLQSRDVMVGEERRRLFKHFNSYGLAPPLRPPPPPFQFNLYLIFCSFLLFFLHLLLRHLLQNFFFISSLLFCRVVRSEFFFVCWLVRCFRFCFEIFCFLLKTSF